MLFQKTDIKTFDGNDDYDDSEDRDDEVLCAVNWWDAVMEISKKITERGVREEGEDGDISWLDIPDEGANKLCQI